MSDSKAKKSAIEIDYFLHANRLCFRIKIINVEEIIVLGAKNFLITIELCVLKDVQNCLNAK